MGATIAIFVQHGSAVLFVLFVIKKPLEVDARTIFDLFGDAEFAVFSSTPLRTALAQLGTAIYFLFFLAMPWYALWESTEVVPKRVTK